MMIKLWRLGVAVGVAVTGVVVLGSATASAAPANLHRVASGFDAPSSAATHIRTVRCQIQGTKVFGVGGEIRGGQGRVAMTRLAPDAGGTSVTVIARERGAFPGDWSLNAYAVCASPVEQYHIEQLTAVGSASETCDSPTTLYGTGAELVTGHPGSTLHEMVPSPVAPPLMSRVSASPFALGAMVRAFAICDRPTGQKVFSGPAAVHSTASCLDGTRVYGTGGVVTTGDPNVVIERVVPNAALTQVSVTARGPAGFAPTVAFAVCA